MTALRPRHGSKAPAAPRRGGCAVTRRRPLGGCPRCGRAAIGFLDFDDGGRLCGRCGGEVHHGA